MTYEPTAAAVRVREDHQPNESNGGAGPRPAGRGGQADRMAIERGDSIERATLKSPPRSLARSLAVGGPLLSVRCWVAHVLLLFNLMGLIGPLAIPPNDQLKGPERRAAPFPESWASRNGRIGDISVFASLSRQIHQPDGRRAAEATETLSNRVRSAFCICSSPPRSDRRCTYIRRSGGTRRQKVTVTRRAVPLN